MATVDSKAAKTKANRQASTDSAVRHTAGRGLMKFREGVVVSDRMDKTVVVSITRLVKQWPYGKYVRKTSKCIAHDEKNECKVGDAVSIVETRPMSRTKRWKVASIVKRAE